MQLRTVRRGLVKTAAAAFLVLAGAADIGRAQPDGNHEPYGSHEPYQATRASNLADGSADPRIAPGAFAPHVFR